MDQSPTQRRVVAGLAVIASFFSILPLLWAALSAFRSDEDIFKYLSELSLWTIIPDQVTFDNFSALWANGFGRALLNSLFVSSATVILGLLICASAAFVLARVDFPFKRLVFAIIVVSFLMPFDAIAIPLASMFRDFGLQNSYWGLILPGIGNGLAIFLLRQFFMEIPRDLSEAAMLDGLGWFGIFTRIYVPLSRSALIAAGLMLFIFQWQAYLWPLLIAPDPDFKVAAVAIADFAGQWSVEYGKIFAAVSFVSLVPAAIVLVFQKYFRGSMSFSGLK